MLRPVRAGVRLFVALALTASSGAAAAAAAGYAYLSAAQLAQLRALPIPIALPASMPPGYRLTQFEVTNRTGEHRYDLTFSDSAKHRVLVEGGDCCFGDAEPDTSSFRRPFTATSPLLGNARFDPYNLGSGWIWAADYIPIDRRTKTLLNIQGNDNAALTRFYGSLQRLPK
jgi:hypothetical protein